MKNSVIKNKFKNVLLILLAFSFATLSFASGELPLIQQDEPLSVDDLIDLAIENQPQYQKIKEDRDLLFKGVKVAYAQLLPSANFSARYSTSRYYNPTPYVDNSGLYRPDYTAKSSNSSWGITLSQDLYLGGSRFYGLKRAQQMLKFNDLSMQRSVDELTNNIQSSVYSLLAQQQLVEVRRDIVKFRTESLRLATKRYETGDVIELDVLQAEIDLGNAENDLLTAEQDLQNRSESLNLLVGIHLESRFPLEGSLTPTLPDNDINNLVSLAMKKNPQFLSLQKNIEISDQDVNIARAQMLPRVSLNAGFDKMEELTGYNKYKFSPQQENRSLGLTLSWTIFNRFELDYQRQRAIVEKRKAVWDKHYTGQQIESSLRSEWRTLNRIYEQIKITEKNRELARRQLDLEQERYRLGASNQLNLRSAQVTFIEAENRHISKILEFYTTRAALERDLGMSLEEVGNNE
ncbi:TolC family protein [bacterium]|nr:TolC family protein [bacterium]